MIVRDQPSSFKLFFYHARVGRAKNSEPDYRRCAIVGDSRVGPSTCRHLARYLDPGHRDIRRRIVVVPWVSQ